MALLARASEVEADGLMFATHAACFAVQAAFTAILLRRFRNRRAGVGPPDETEEPLDHR